MSETRKKIRIISEDEILISLLTGLLGDIYEISDSADVDGIIFDQSATKSNNTPVSITALNSAAEPVPVFFIGYADDEQELAALNAGAADYMAKPFNPDILKLRVTRIFP